MEVAEGGYGGEEATCLANDGSCFEFTNFMDFGVAIELGDAVFVLLNAL